MHSSDDDERGEHKLDAIKQRDYEQSLLGDSDTDESDNYVKTRMNDYLYMFESVDALVTVEEHILNEAPQEEQGFSYYKKIFALCAIVCLIIGNVTVRMVVTIVVIAYLCVYQLLWPSNVDEEGVDIEMQQLT